MTIPPVLLKLMQIDIGGQLSLSVDGGELIARPISAAKKRYSLAQLLEGSEAMAELNVQTASSRDGESVGREL